MSSYRFTKLPARYGIAEIPAVMAIKSAEKLAVGLRLRRVRMAKKLTGRTLANMIGLGCTEQKISNYEHGTDLLPVRYAAKVWATTGADFNYLYGDSMANIPPALRDAILELDESEVSVSRKRRKAS